MAETKTCTLCDGTCVVAGKSCPRCRATGKERIVKRPTGVVPPAHKNPRAV